MIKELTISDACYGEIFIRCEILEETKLYYTIKALGQEDSQLVWRHNIIDEVLV